MDAKQTAGVPQWQSQSPTASVSNNINQQIGCLVPPVHPGGSMVNASVFVVARA